MTRKMMAIDQSTVAQSSGMEGDSLYSKEQVRGSGVNVRKVERTVRHRKQQQEREAKEKLRKKMELREQQKRRDKQKNRSRNEERDMRRTEMVAYRDLKHQYSKVSRRGYHGKERDGVS